MTTPFFPFQTEITGNVETSILQVLHVRNKNRYFWLKIEKRLSRHKQTLLNIQFSRLF